MELQLVDFRAKCVENYSAKSPNQEAKGTSIHQIIHSREQFLAAAKNLRRTEPLESHACSKNCLEGN